ncbi:MAG: sigma-70 family RNA polymerase sigma factor [Lachnospiraceae bacterium]|nr:sigma-70 family RNA polymerase sigma factor [Lachnospiraceae bacterium]
MPANKLCNRLINEYGNTIFRMCYLYLKDYHLAEDAAQETFLRAVRAYDSFVHKSSEKTWLIKIALNCCKNIMRTRWFRFDFANIEDHPDFADKKNQIDEIILKDAISSAIMKLPILDREIILLYYYEELSLKEMSSIIGKSESAAMKRLSRARKKIKDILKEELL